MTILNKEVIMTTPFPATALIIAVTVFVLLFILAAVTDCDLLMYVCMILLITIATFGSWMEIDTNRKETGRYKYEVMIDDSVSAKEFIDKYDFVEKKGHIYIIQDREIEE